MKTVKIFLFLLILAAIIYFLGGCKKNPDTATNPTANSKNSVTDNALAENLFNNVKDWSDQAMAGAALKSTLTDTVPSLAINNSNQYSVSFASFNAIDSLLIKSAFDLANSASRIKPPIAVPDLSN